MLGIGEPAYHVAHAGAERTVDGDWEKAVWRSSEGAPVDRFLAPSSDHRPTTEAKLARARDGLHGIFRVQDRYVLSTRRDYQSAVYRDACVEFFVRPKADLGYFHFEMNCCGVLLAEYVEDPARTAEGFAKAVRLPWEVGKLVEVYGSMGDRVEPEIAGEVAWVVEFFVPFGVLERYVGELGAVGGAVWRGNFYKCSEDNSHPHWASWAPMGEEFNFHQPDRFGWLVFE